MHCGMACTFPHIYIYAPHHKNPSLVSRLPRSGTQTLKVQCSHSRVWLNVCVLCMEHVTLGMRLEKSSTKPCRITTVSSPPVSSLTNVQANNQKSLGMRQRWHRKGETIALFPGFLCLQFLITCSMFFQGRHCTGVVYNETAMNNFVKIVPLTGEKFN